MSISPFYPHTRPFRCVKTLRNTLGFSPRASGERVRGFREV